MPGVSTSKGFEQSYLLLPPAVLHKYGSDHDRGMISTSSEVRGQCHIVQRLNRNLIDHFFDLIQSYLILSDVASAPIRSDFSHLCPDSEGQVPQRP
jgi:hypothetical protein